MGQHTSQKFYRLRRQTALLRGIVGALLTQYGSRIVGALLTQYGSRTVGALLTQYGSRIVGAFLTQYGSRIVGALLTQYGSLAHESVQKRKRQILRHIRPRCLSCYNWYLCKGLRTV